MFRNYFINLGGGVQSPDVNVLLPVALSLAVLTDARGSEGGNYVTWSCLHVSSLPVGGLIPSKWDEKHLQKNPCKHWAWVHSCYQVEEMKMNSTSLEPTDLFKVCVHFGTNYKFLQVQNESRNEFKFEVNQQHRRFNVCFAFCYSRTRVLVLFLYCSCWIWFKTHIV